MADKKKTRESQYNEILAERHNTNVARCAVVAFTFPNEGKQHGFHFALMQQKNTYYIYDGTENRAIVVMPRLDAEIRGVQALAAIYSGEEYTPNLKL